MAKNNFTFQTAIKLNSAGFKKGVADVKSAIAGLRSSFLSLAGALGAGLGFTQLISNLKDTAVQLSVAKNTLENVSKTTKTFKTSVGDVNVEVSNYAENLEWCKNLARSYSQDMVSLISNFAQFHAACEKTNLDLENQKLVFEALTKAAAYYHMSADRSRDMMNAITQMMSKGKVSAEELRRQLGNALPGAFNLMAAALGVSTAELEDMMKKGQVISAEVLPKFAAMLNTVTKNADFNSLQMSLNQLKNTWYDLVENSGAEGLFNNIVQGANKVLSVISRNISVIKSGLKGIAAGILTFSGFRYLTNEGKKYLAETEKQLTKLARVQQQQMKKMWGSESGYAAFAQQMNGKQMGGGPLPITLPMHAGGKTVKDFDQEELKLIREYNETVIEIAQAKKAQLLPTMVKERQIQNDIVKAAKSTNKEIDKQIGKTKVAGNAVKGLQVLWAGVQSIAKSVWTMIKANAIMAIVSAVLGAITAVWDYFKHIREENERIANIYSDYEREMKQVDTSTQETNNKLRAQLAYVQDTNNELGRRKRALEDINKTLGLTGDNAFGLDALDKTKQAYKDIVNVVEDWIKASITLAKVQAHAAAGAQAEAKIIQLQTDIAEKEKRLREISVGKGADKNGDTVYGPKSLLHSGEYKKLNDEIKLGKKEISALQNVVKSADAEVTKLYEDYYKILAPTENGPGGGGGGGGKTETELSKLVDKFTKDKKELENKLREHAITQEEYNDELDKLVQQYWKSAAGTGQMSIEEIIDKMDKGKTLTAMEKWYSDLYSSAQQAAFNATVKAAGEAIEAALDDAIKEADEVIQKDLQDFAEKMARTATADLNALLSDKPARQKRSKTFDYNKSKSDIFEEEAEISRNHADELEEAINDIVSSYDKIEDASDAVKAKLAEWRQELSIARKEAASLEEAMNLAKVQEDIDELEKSINSTLYNGLKNGAQSLDRVIKGMESLRDVMESTDSTGWEKFMAVFNELVQIVETCVSAFQTLDAIQEATNKKEQAELSLEAQKVALLEREIALREALRIQRAAETKETEKAAAANLAEASTAKVAASAKAGEAVAGATASGAKLPFPYNLAAIAAGIAAVLAALAAMSKFANGGIVGGNSWSGDKQMARVNSGEMILNKAQQRNLWELANGKAGTSGQVNFKIRGADLVGVLNNEMSRRRG